MASNGSVRRSTRFVVLITLSLALLIMWGATTTTAQVTATPVPLTCAQLLPQVQNNLAAGCANLDRDLLCYGNRTVSVDYADDGQPHQPFIQVGDLVPLRMLKSIRTGPLSLATGEWGLAVLKVQASVPGATAGQAVTFVLYGDTQITDVVRADTTTPGGPVCTGTTTRTTYLRGTPQANGPQLRLLQPNTPVNIIGRLPGTQWLRAEVQGQLGWVFLTTLRLDCDANALPVVGGDQPMTMPGLSAFYVTTGISPQAACQDIPPGGLLIQSPQGQKVTFRANGADITIGSDVLIRSQPNQTFALAVLRGQANIVLPRSSQAAAAIPPLIVRAGNELSIPLGGANGLEFVGRPIITRIPQQNPLHLATVCALGKALGLDIPCQAVPPTFTPRPRTRVPVPTRTPRPNQPLPPSPQASGPNCTFTLQRFTANPNPGVFDDRQGLWCSTLFWDVEGVETVFLNGQGVTGHGSQNVCVKQNTTYTLTMNCGGVSKSASVTLRIR